MPKFVVSYARTDFFDVIVEAPSVEDAQEKAWAVITEHPDPVNQFLVKCSGFEEENIEEMRL